MLTGDKQHLRARASSEAGFSLLEALIALLLLAGGLLSHASLAISEHRLSGEEQYRSEGLHVARQFVERMRADEDWSGLYARLRALQDAANVPTAGAPLLEDGRMAYAPHAYFPDFSLSERMSSLSVLVDVPSSPDPLTPTDPRVLREDLVNARYGLPSDLNGDGLIDDQPRDDDYAVLPVRIIVRWVPTGEASREFDLRTYLRGDR